VNATSIDPAASFGWLIVIVGAIRLVHVFQCRGWKGRIWPLLGGVAGVTLGGMIATRWPASSFFLIGLFIAIELIANGRTIVMVVLAARASGASPQVEQPA
jgi:uncharacterized membrane protein HdeD (DUF308 family)